VARRAKKERVLVLCALPYTNAVPHVGNLVGSHLPADIFARYCRSKGAETLFVGGTDENGTPTEVAARELEVTPRELTDVLYEVQKGIYSWFGISYDNFSRTSRPIHHATTQQFFLTIMKKGFVSEGVLRLPFCEKDGIFLPDRYVVGTCPVCGYEFARGDQCERCSTLLDPIQLIDPKCAVDGSTPIFRDSKQLFLELGKVQGRLERWIGGRKLWRRQVTSLAMGWIKEGLRKRSITRDLKWGVPVPFEGYRDKVFYVWFDAPIGYLSATKEWAELGGRPSQWKKFWLDKGTKVYNFLGKDNIPFHTIFWPGMLFAHGGFNMPLDVVGLQFCNYEGDKISKSRNWGIFCEKIPEAGLDPDIWRYYLTHLIPETRDTEFKWQEFANRVNNELIAKIGNLFHRTATFSWNNYGGKVSSRRGSPAGRKLSRQVLALATETGRLLDEVQLREAMARILAIADLGNEFFQKSEPWRLVKDDRDECEEVLYSCLETCRVMGIVLQPFLPGASNRMLEMLGSPGMSWRDIRKPRRRIELTRKPEILFKKLEAEQIEAVKPLVTRSRPVEDYFKK
jgi:methionyl-tRNA synthetase